MLGRERYFANVTVSDSKESHLNVPMTIEERQSSQKHTHQRVRKAVLPAAGLGTRFLPATKAQPKEMLTVVDKPQIQYVAEECVASGIEHIIIVTGKGKNSIEDHFDNAPVLERFLEEHGKSKQKWCGASAIWCR
jgi:hypothetical protein